jgi:hypothetical protein
LVAPAARRRAACAPRGGPRETPRETRGAVRGRARRQFAALMTESGLAVQHVALLNFGSVALYTAVPV